MYLLSQINKNPAITTVTKRGIFGGGRGLLSSSLRNIKALLIYETGSLGSEKAAGVFLFGEREKVGAPACERGAGSLEYELSSSFQHQRIK